MSSLNSEIPSPTPINSFSPTSWIFLAIMIAAAIFIWNRLRNSKSAVHERALERFKYTHREVFPLLSTKEKKEMLHVLENTIWNAELSKRDQEFAKVRRDSPKKAINKDRKVCFKL